MSISRAPATEYHEGEVIGYSCTFTAPTLYIRRDRSWGGSPGRFDCSVRIQAGDKRDWVPIPQKDTDQVFMKGQQPTAEDLDHAEQMLKQEYPLFQQRIVVVEQQYDKRREQFFPRPYIASLDFKNPTLAVDTKPENTVIESAPVPAPLTVSIGETVRSRYQLKKLKRQQQKEA